MQTYKIAIKRSQSECLPQMKIISPSPIKQTSLISSRVASEIFDISSITSNSETSLSKLSPMKPLRVRFCSARMDYESGTEWSSESSCTTSSQGDCDSPNVMITKNPYHQENIFEDISADLPSRASNPIINDSKFGKFDKEPFESSSQAKLFSKLNAFNY